ALEQLTGGAQDAKSDQFGFCATLYEALFGVRPFEGKTLGELIAQLRADAVREPGATARVPGWVRRVVWRGLKADPSQRFASMDEVLSALERDPAQSRWRAAAAAAFAVVLISI